MPPKPYLLIVANSGRMLAQAAYNNDFEPIVIDQYADSDTASYAAICYQVPSLALQHLQPLVLQCMANYPLTQVVYGSGLEIYPESLVFLASCLTVWGNAPASFMQLLDKPAFFALLRSLNIAHPATLFTPPAMLDHWLVKPQRGQGGLGVHYAAQQLAADTPIYWQRYQAGRVGSVLFLAQHERVQIVGFNTQWSRRIDTQTPFAFTGIMNTSCLLAAWRTQLTDWIVQLSAALSLQGLNSLDFIWTGERCLVLEINGRPPASMQLYAADLLAQHIAACQGLMPMSTPATSEICGYQICYAPREISIPNEFNWPNYCLDLPQNGVIINAWRPICSIAAMHHNPVALRKRLQGLQHSLLKKLLKGTQTYGI